MTVLLLSDDDISNPDFNSIFGWKISRKHWVTISLGSVYDPESRLMPGTWTVRVDLYQYRKYGADVLLKSIELDQCLTKDTEVLKEFAIPLDIAISYSIDRQGKIESDMRLFAQAALRRFGKLYVVKDVADNTTVRLILNIEANGVSDEFDTRGVPISLLQNVGKVTPFYECDLPT